MTDKAKIFIEEGAAQSSGASPLLYDSGLLYDDGHLYDSLGDDPSQSEKAKISGRQ